MSGLLLFNQHVLTQPSPRSSKKHQNQPKRTLKPPVKWEFFGADSSVVWLLLVWFSFRRSIREVRKQRNKTSRVFYQYNLVQAARVDDKIKQRIILYLGSAPLLRDKNNCKTVLKALKYMIFKQADLLADKVPKNLFALARPHYDRCLISLFNPAGLSVGEHHTIYAQVKANPL